MHEYSKVSATLSKSMKTTGCSEGCLEGIVHMGVLETQGPCHTIQPEDPEPEQAPLRPAKPKHPAFITSGWLEPPKCISHKLLTE